MNIKYDFANMALEGGRPQEAMKIFMEIVAEDNDAMAWCGLGSSKFNLIFLNEATIEEVVFCYNKAKQLSPDSTEEIERSFLSFSLLCLNQLNQLAILSDEQKKAEKKAMGWAIVATGVAAVVGSRHSSNAFTQLASLAVAGAGVNQVIKSIEGTDEMISLLENSKSLASQLYSSSLKFIESEVIKADFIQELPAPPNTSNSQPQIDAPTSNFQGILDRFNLHLQKNYDSKLCSEFLVDEQITIGLYSSKLYLLSDGAEMENFYLFRSSECLFLVGKSNDSMVLKKYQPHEFQSQYTKGGVFSANKLTININGEAPLILTSDNISYLTLKAF